MSLKKMQSSSEIPAVLVIESAKFQRRSLCRLIRAAGADRVAEAIGIKDAERVLAKDTASHWLVVADPELIGNDGIPALKALADAFPVVGTLLLSHRRANLLGELRGQAERHGLDFIAVLRKPVSAEEMGTLLLQTRRLQIPGRSADTRMRILGKEELSECLRAGGLRARFQPKVDLDTGCPVGCEAAPFVNHANGVLSFASFSQALKQLNAQRVMTASLLRDAAELVGLLRERSLGAKVAVKLGADMLSEAGDAASLDAYVRTLGIAPSDLAFEVTDGTKAASSFTFDDNLARLKVRGYYLALEIAAPAPALGEVALMHFSEIKIRPSGNTPRDWSAVAMSHAELLVSARKLGMAICAVGLRTEGDLDDARRAGFMLGQGDLFASALTAEQAMIWAVREEKARSFADRTPKRNRAS